ncbi:hypothetical protein DTO164E3_8710 [Paecilomyces variotii]|nr:hypothetical protein DTO164E3_8710 [Paecilomyces variotii]KAJ9206993.1 hypothetical protein DTO032I3_1581 [Paecilomyces variotii]KAJ9238552.1 hypothetical protein DTO169E5_4752 [Paecilomyces variotii]KAJ9255440.1 hypothetical protein DTO207G8_3196 [Paecilomyces variotii]KAJ9281506.1 hypothetical protein DTO021D3_1729 [Paecilomyces variotii]
MALNPLLKSRGRPILDTTPWKQQENQQRSVLGLTSSILKYYATVQSRRYPLNTICVSPSSPFYVRQGGFVLIGNRNSLPTTTELYLSRYLKATQA